MSCVPDSLYMFLNVQLGGETQLEPRDNEDCDSRSHHKRILSLGQDVVYAVSNRAKWTPKHIGLGSTLHQVTRSKQLVDLFNKAHSELQTF